MSKLECDFIKIASHSASNIILIYKVIETGRPFFISLGALKKEEKNFLVDKILPKDNCAVFHCVSQYPSASSNQYLDSITEIKNQQLIPGFSTHETGFYASVIATFLGARFIERHISLSNASIGFDHAISMEPKDFAEMSKVIKHAYQMRGRKNLIINQEKPARENYHSGLYTKQSHPAGYKLTLSDLVALQPLGSDPKSLSGIEFELLPNKELTKPINAGEQLLKTYFS